MAVVAFPPDVESFRRSLTKTGLPDDVVERLTAQARPAILLTTDAGDEAAIPRGASKIGGRPDLPRGTAWPTRPAYSDAFQRTREHCKEADRLLTDSRKKHSWITPEQGERFSAECMAKAGAVNHPFPMAFLGQFDLASLSREKGFDTALPREGRLLLFYDLWEMPDSSTPEASVGWLVLWETTDASELVRLEVPSALSSISSGEWSCVFRAVTISPKSVLTPIPTNDKSWDAFSLDDDALLEAYDKWLAQFGSPEMTDRDNHQLGGFPQPLQNGLQARSEWAAHGLTHAQWETEAAEALLKSAKDWRLVLQIGSDKHAGIPQLGAYYVMMRGRDIAARRFDRARVVYQCD